MVRTIPHRELRNNSSAVLRDVQAGETIEVTNHGEVVAILTPPTSSAGSRLGVRKAIVRGRFSELEKFTIDHQIQDTLDELRGER